MTVDFQRWTAKRKSEVVVGLLKGEISMVDICREQDLQQSVVEEWIEMFLRGGETNLKSNSKEEKSVHAREVKELRAKVGELVLELDARKKMQALDDEREKSF